MDLLRGGSSKKVEPLCEIYGRPLLCETLFDAVNVLTRYNWK
jgi:hypothetical protein